MSTTIVNEQIIYGSGQSSGLVIDDQNDLNIGRSGYIGAEGGFNAVEIGDYCYVQVNGEIAGSEYRAALAGGSDDRIIVGRTGIITGGEGIATGGDFGGIVINNGSIDTEGTAIEIEGSGSQVTNAGSLTSATSAAVFVIGTSRPVISNSGTMSGQTYGVFYGQNASDTDVVIRNTGFIEGRAGSAIYISTGADGASHIYNSGIVSQVVGDGDGAVHGGNGQDFFYNDGTILGDVRLRGGDDTFNTIRGEVRGLIDGGTGNDNITGGRFDDFILGGDGNDTLNGGIGDDILDGGVGTDSVTYRTTAAAVTVDLALTGSQATGGSGLDTLTNIEAIIGSLFGDRLLGSSRTNVLSGDNGNDFLDGRAGADRLGGGAGADTFAFSTTLGATNIDTITDFTAVDDTISLSQTVFAGLSSGVLAAGAFYAGTGAHEADDRIIYDAGTGALLFDRDGSGGTYAATQFATISKNLTLTSADFVVA